jgi:hypothetical protein
LLELLGTEISLQHGILKHFPLCVAAADASQLIEARRVEERLHRPYRLAISPLREGVDAPYQGERDFPSQGVSLVREGPQPVDHLPHVDFITGDRESQGSMGIPEGRARPRRSRGSQVAYFLQWGWGYGATVQRPTPQQGGAVV